MSGVFWDTRYFYHKADNYAVVKEILANKYCLKVSLFRETQSGHCPSIMALIRGMIQNDFDAM